MDIPFTLNALNKAVESHSKMMHMGNDVKEALFEYREIRNFYRTLECLIQKSSFTEGMVTVEIVHI